MKLRKEVCLLFLGTCLLSACGGGGISSSPKVFFSPNSLSFSDEAIGNSTSSQPVTLTNSGTGTLNIAGIVASTSFAETDSCGPTLAPGANCLINVTFTPSGTAGVAGTLSITDNAPASPQQVALSGAVAPGTLSGFCWGVVSSGIRGDGCSSGASPEACVVGQAATTPTLTGCNGLSDILVDTSTSCTFQYRNGRAGGYCVVMDGGAAASGRAGIEP